MKAGSLLPSGGWRRGLRRAGGLWTIYAGSAARLLISGPPTEMVAVRYTLAHLRRIEPFIGPSDTFGYPGTM